MSEHGMRVYMVKSIDHNDPDVGVYLVAAPDAGVALSLAISDEYVWLQGDPDENIVSLIDSITMVPELDEWVKDQSEGAWVPTKVAWEAGVLDPVCMECDVAGDVGYWIDDELMTCMDCAEEEGYYDKPEGMATN